MELARGERRFKGERRYPSKMNVPISTTSFLTVRKRIVRRRVVPVGNLRTCWVWPTPLIEIPNGDINAEYGHRRETPRAVTTTMQGTEWTYVQNMEYGLPNTEMAEYGHQYEVRRAVTTILVRHLRRCTQHRGYRLPLTEMRKEVSGPPTLKMCECGVATVLCYLSYLIL